MYYLVPLMSYGIWSTTSGIIALNGFMSKLVLLWPFLITRASCQVISTSSSSSGSSFSLLIKTSVSLDSWRKGPSLCSSHWITIGDETAVGDKTGEIFSQESSDITITCAVEGGLALNIGEELYLDDCGELEGVGVVGLFIFTTG